MKTIFFLLSIFTCMVCHAQVSQDPARIIPYKATLSIVHITLEKADGSLLPVDNVMRLNFKNDSTLIIRYKDSTTQYYNIKQADIAADTITAPVYQFIPLYTDKSFKPYFNDSSQTTVKFTIEYK